MPDLSPDFVGTLYNAVVGVFEHYTGRCDPGTLAHFTARTWAVVQAIGGGWVDVGTNANHVLYCWAGGPPLR